MKKFLLDSDREKRRGIAIFSLLIFCTLASFSQGKVNADSIIVRKNAGDEILNIGYGNLKKRENVTSLTRIISDDFNKGNINDPIQLIQGKVAGLSVSKAGGDPNGSYYIRLRGMTTISGVEGPLIVVDGVPGALLGNIDPYEIESIDILKDAAAASIYGVRGSEGVILVTTKRGKNGKTIIEYNVNASVEKVAKNEPVMNPAQWRAMSLEEKLGTDFGASTNWFKETEQTALSQVHNLSMSGGTDKTNYRASINYRTGDGVLINTGYNQLNGRFNITQKALNDKLIFNLNMGATERDSRIGFPEAFKYAAIFNPTSPVKSADPAYIQYDGYTQQVLFDYYNPVAIQELDKNDMKNRIFNLSLKGTYEIFKGMNVDAIYSVQSNGSTNGKYFDKNDLWGGYNTNGLASRQQDNSENHLFESTLHFNDDLSSKLNLDLIGGYSFQDFNNEGFYEKAGNFLTDDFTYNNLSAALDFKNGRGTIASYKNENRLSAFFGRINLNFNNLWYISASARYEGSSRLGSANKWGLFHALGTGIDLSKIARIKSLDNFKLRIDYGITGNQPADSYRSLELYEEAGRTWYNGQFIPGYYSPYIANPGLKPEKKSEVDAGLDFSMFKSRLTGSFDFYSQTASDLFYQYRTQLTPIDFVSSYIWLNSWKIKSHGMELALNFRIIQKSDFSYTLSLNYSHNSPNILSSLSTVYNDVVLKDLYTEIGDVGSPGPGQQSVSKLEEGKPIGRLYAFIFKEIDENGSLVFGNTNNDQYIDSRDRVPVGDGLPKALAGIGNTLTYKNWDLNFFFRSVTGHSLENNYRSFYETPQWISAYNLPISATQQRNSTNGTLSHSYGGTVTNFHVENASFISLDNFCLGYNFTLPEASPVNKIRLYFSGNNLFYITKYRGPDPNPRYLDSESSYTYVLGAPPLLPGIDRRATWPRTRSFTFGVNVVF